MAHLTVQSNADSDDQRGETYSTEGNVGGAREVSDEEEGSEDDEEAAADRRLAQERVTKAHLALDLPTQPTMDDTMRLRTKQKAERAGKRSEIICGSLIKTEGRKWAKNPPQPSRNRTMTCLI